MEVHSNHGFKKQTVKFFCPELKKSGVGGGGLRSAGKVWSSRFGESAEEATAIRDWLLHCSTLYRVQSTQVLHVPSSVEQSRG